jgi:dihydroflavonol-4-reductase
VPLCWSFAADVADVAVSAAERGRAGSRYLAITPAEDSVTIAEFLTRACRVGDIDHRVEDVPPSDDPAYDEEFAGMARMSRRAYPAPLFENHRTIDDLGFLPKPLDEGLGETVAWLRGSGEV